MEMIIKNNKEIVSLLQQRLGKTYGHGRSRIRAVDELGVELLGRIPTDLEKMYIMSVAEAKGYHVFWSSRLRDYIISYKTYRYVASDTQEVSVAL